MTDEAGLWRCCYIFSAPCVRPYDLIWNLERDGKVRGRHRSLAEGGG